MANTTFNGGTGGVFPLGPNGASMSAEALNVPDTISRPKGYDYEYTTHQQGTSAEVKCKPRPRGTEIANITWFDTLGAVRVDYACGPRSLYEIIYAGSASVAPVLCPEFNQDVYDADPSDSSYSDPDYTTLQLIDIARKPQYGPALRETLLGQGNGEDGNLDSVLGGDVSCTMRATWSDREVRYSSPSNTFTVEDGPGSNVTYITGIDHELFARNLTQEARVDVLSNGTATDDEYRWFSRQWQSGAGYDAARSVFWMSERLGPPAISPIGYPSNQTFGNAETGEVTFSYLPGQNNAVLHVWQFDLEQKPDADNTTQRFEVAHLEPFIQGVIEYAQTAQRQTFAYELSDPETRNLGVYGPEWHATRNVPGVWNASTVGWGNGEQGETESSTIVYASLTPLLVFAALSFALVAWSHYYDRPNGTPYLAECDPIDFVDAVIASSQGGLQNSFHRDALLKEHGSLHGARAVKVRLGQIYRKDDPDGLPKLGFVDVN